MRPGIDPSLHSPSSPVPALWGRTPSLLGQTDTLGDGPGALVGAASPEQTTVQDPSGDGGVEGEDALGMNWPSTLMALAGAVILSFTLLRILARQRAASRHEPSPASERIREIRERASSHRGPVEAVMADAVELTNRLAAQLDNRAERIEQLLDEAHEAADRLERALDRASRVRENGLARAAPSSDSASRGIDPGPSDGVHAQIYRLADEGLDASAIAHETGQPRGQVELVLALRRG